jgi:hypothetical protein
MLFRHFLVPFQFIDEKTNKLVPGARTLNQSQTFQTFTECEVELQRPTKRNFNPTIIIRRKTKNQQGKDKKKAAEAAKKRK